MPIVSAPRPVLSGLEALAHGAILSPFTRTRRLLDGVAPGHARPIELTVGDPREAMPAFTAATGHLPDLDALEREQEFLRRTAAFYLCSPANPQGAIATPDYIRRALALARRYDFMLFFDECYSEIYTGAAPTGGLEIAAATPERFKNLVVFNSLSKRSNLPGLRSGFVAGDGDFLEMLAEIRNQMAPQMP